VTANVFIGGDAMNKSSKGLKCLVLLSIFIFAAIHCFAEENTEITGYYQQYRNFSFKTGNSSLDFADAKLKGGGFTIAQNIESWFAVWTQLSVFGSLDQTNGSVRVLNNLQGIRYQTKNHGPFRFYVKGGMGFTYYSLSYQVGSTSGTKFSAAYGGGTHIWFHKHFGVVIDVSHVLMGLPNLTDLSGRESWDSGLTYTTGLTVKF
jgi:hypothetical protein